MTLSGIPESSFDISQVERDTGISKDTLRVWERRYGFPKPPRDSNGERRYDAADIEKLRLLKRLMDGGGRPGKLVGRSIEELLRSGLRAPALDPSANENEGFADIVARLAAHDGPAVLAALSQALMRLGLQQFVLTVLAPLNTWVGDGWADGTLATFDEHLYTEQVQTLLRTVVVNMPRRAESPRVLLTTLPQEQHGLGILMVEALLAGDNVYCVSLGTQTPVQDLVAAAGAHRADIVGLSFSGSFPRRAAMGALASLCRQLPRDVDVWVGGTLAERMRQLPNNAQRFESLESVVPAIAAWRTRHPRRAGGGAASGSAERRQSGADELAKLR
jgi:methylmalonyl-CoA mutase cobalamin-binding subunit